MKIISNGRIFVRFCMCLWLVGCTSTLPVKESAQHQDALDLVRWQCVGRVAIKLEQKGTSANIDWQQSNGEYQINFSGPLGIGNARLVGMPGQVLLYQDGKLLAGSSSAEELTALYLGAELPVSGLVYWIRGIPDPGSPWQYLSETQFRQQGWNIEIVQRQLEHGFLLPRKLKLTRAQIKITFVVQEWIIESETPTHD